MADILRRILEVKADEVAHARRARPLEALREAAHAAPPARDFVGALRARIAAGQPAVIAEIKKASPSRGVLREAFDPAEIARSYAGHGAACLSVLTDATFFQGKAEDLALARAAGGIPALRKDFMVDEYQLYESRALGADCVLLIVAALERTKLQAFEELAHELGMAVLVEVHDGEELNAALALDTPLIGINNRDLKTFVTRLETSWNLAQHVPRERIVVTESGISTRADVAEMLRHNIHSFLVGEAFVRVHDPGSALHNIFSID